MFSNSTTKSSILFLQSKDYMWLINLNDIKEVRRHGKGSIIRRTTNEEYTVNMPFEDFCKKLLDVAGVESVM